MLQIKETGTPVDFTQGAELNLQNYLYMNDVFGVYTPQKSPITIDAATRNALVNGDLIDLQAQASAQGMEIQYLRISWNETQTDQGDYYITDFVVGVVAKVTRDFNTGPAYLIDALKKVEWLDQILSKISTEWKSWLLIKATRSESYKTFQEVLVSDWEYLSSNIGTPLPSLPSATAVKNQILQEGAFDESLGAFVVKMLDEGYVITMFGYRVQVCFEKGEAYRSSTYTRTYKYRVHIRFAWDFVSTPDFDIVTGTTTFEPFTITTTFIFGLIALVGAIIIGTVFTYNLTRTESGYIIWEVLRDADGNPIFDENGDPILYPGEEGWETGPPDWWKDVATTAVVGAIIIAGLVIIVPPVIKSLRGK